MTPSKVKQLCAYAVCLSFVVIGVQHPPHIKTIKIQPVSFVARTAPLIPAPSPTTTTTSTTQPAPSTTEPQTTTTAPVTRRSTTTTTTPEPTPEETPIQEPASESGDVADMIRSVFGTEKAVRVATCESGLDPANVNGQYRGLFQLGNYHKQRAADMGYTWNQMFEAMPNIKVAYNLFLEQGWGPWECKYA